MTREERERVLLFEKGTRATFLRKSSAKSFKLYQVKRLQHHIN